MIHKISSLIKRFPQFTITFLIIGQFMIYNYAHFLQVPIMQHHSWRQADCISFALNFYNDKANLLEPMVNNLGQNNDGKAATDFPIVQYIIGNIWKITGVNIGIYKFTNMLFLFFGLFYLFKLFIKITENNITLSIILTLLFNTSPNLSYFGISTISDIQALSLSLIALYFLFNFLSNFSNKNLIVFISVFSLAGLLKASAAFSYSICAFMVLFCLITNYKTLGAKKVLLSLSSLALPLVVWYLWFSYANRYNLKHPTGFFLVGILPIWEIESTKEKFNILRSLIDNKLDKMYPLLFLVPLLISGVYLIISKFKAFLFESSVMIVSLICFIAYILLFYFVFSEHDYYLINMQCVLLLFFIMQLKIFLKTKADLLKAKSTIIIFLFLLVGNTQYSSSLTWSKWRYKPDSFLNTFIYNEFESSRAEYFLWTNAYRYSLIENPAFKLDYLGIKQSDIILCLGDYTINRSLVALNRSGYTDYNVASETIDLFIKEKKKIGLKYIVIIEPNWLNNEKLKSFLTHKIYQKEAVSIYSLD